MKHNKSVSVICSSQIDTYSKPKQFHYQRKKRQGIQNIPRSKKMKVQTIHFMKNLKKWESYNTTYRYGQKEDKGQGQGRGQGQGVRSGIRAKTGTQGKGWRGADGGRIAGKREMVQECFVSRQMDKEIEKVSGNMEKSRANDMNSNCRQNSVASSDIQPSSRQKIHHKTQYHSQLQNQNQNQTQKQFYPIELILNRLTSAPSPITPYPSSIAYKKRPSIQRLSRKTQKSDIRIPSQSTLNQNQNQNQTPTDQTPLQIQKQRSKYQRKTCKMFNLDYKMENFRPLQTMNNLIWSIEASTYQQIEERVCMADGRELKQFKVFKSNKVLERKGKSKSRRKSLKKQKENKSQALSQSQKSSNSNSNASQESLNPPNQPQPSPSPQPIFKGRRKTCRKSRFSETLDQQKLARLQENYISAIQERDGERENQRESEKQNSNRNGNDNEEGNGNFVVNLDDVPKIQLCGTGKRVRRDRKARRSKFNLLANQNSIDTKIKLPISSNPLQHSLSPSPNPKSYKWQNWTHKPPTPTPHETLSSLQALHKLNRAHTQNRLTLHKTIESKSKELYKLECLYGEIRKLEENQELIQGILGDRRDRVQGLMRAFLGEVQGVFGRGSVGGLEKDWL